MSRRRAMLFRVLMSLALAGPMGSSGFAAQEPQGQGGEESTAPASPKSTGTRFTPMAQEFLKAAKAKLEAQQQAQAEHEEAHQREAAQRLAVQLGQQKLKQEAAQEREA